MKILIVKLLATAWAVLTVLGALVLLYLLVLYVLLPAATFLAGCLERRHLRPLTRGREPPRRVQESVAAATQRRYRELGLYRGKLGLWRFDATLLLSDDDRILMLMAHDLSGPQLITRLAGGQRILTGTDALPDLSGLDDVELVTGDFEAVDTRHRRRLNPQRPGGSFRPDETGGESESQGATDRARPALRPEVVAFDAAQIGGHLLEHMREQVRRLHAAGLARYLKADRSSWAYTARGSWRLTREAWTKLTGRGVRHPHSDEEAKVRGFRRRRSLQRCAFLQALWLLPGGKLFEAAYPQWVSALPAWADSAIQVVFVSSVIVLLGGMFSRLRCPICKNSFADEEGSMLLFTRIEKCRRCGTEIDPGPS